MKRIFFILPLLTILAAFSLRAADRIDLQKIKEETTDEKSKYYYPKLLKMFLSNDTLMDADDYNYFYYGTMYQEDYDPYRNPVNEKELKRIEHLYYQPSHTRAEKEDMLKYATAAIQDNPLDLLQIKNLVYVYEKNKKLNLAKIWKNKLNNLLKTIANSGTGKDSDNAWIVVYPRHEFDFLNISGIGVESSEFQPPYYEQVKVHRKSDKDPEAYYFNLQPVLEQYYLKHPSEK